MAVAAPKRRSQTQAAPAPARTTPPEPKKRPRDRPRPGGPGRSASAAAPATAPKRGKGAAGRKAASAAPATAPKKGRKAASSAKAGSARASAATAAPTRKAAPRRKAATAPARKTAPKRRAPARVIPIAAGTVGRTAVAVTQLPESGLIHRLTRGRAWIALLGVLLIGIVGLNVVTLSFAASAGKVEESNLALSKDNSRAAGRLAALSGQERLHREAKELGLSPQMKVEPTSLAVTKDSINRAAARLAAMAGAAGAATSEGEAGAGEVGATEEPTAGGEGAAGESGVPSEAEMAGMSQEELNAVYEETLAREAAEAEAVVTEVPTE
jgi:hypothetical protein